MGTAAMPRPGLCSEWTEPSAGRIPTHDPPSGIQAACLVLAFAVIARAEALAESRSAMPAKPGKPQQMSTGGADF